MRERERERERTNKTQKEDLKTNMNEFFH